MPRESKAKKKQRVAKMIRELQKAYPDARTELHYSNPLELLVATILSAQCTDAKVNQVTAELFSKYKTAADFARAPQGRFEQEIRPTGFYRNKAKSIRKAAAMIDEQFGGQVPESMDELVSLPGVARKTANVILGNAFGRDEGVCVDTHVQRLAQRLKLTAHKDNQGDRIEKDLMELVPQKHWTDFAHQLILHGRRVCTARKPDCEGCVIQAHCPSAFKV